MSLIATPTVELIAPRRVRLSWTGTLGYLAWIMINGRLVDGPLQNDVTARTRDLNVPDLYRLEIHEGPDTEGIEPIAPLLQRRANLFWTAKPGAARYNVYRRANAAANERIIATVVKDPDRLYFEIQTEELRADRAVWNTFRIEAVNARGAESVRGEIPIFVTGVPPQLGSMAVVGIAGVFDFTFGA